MDKDFLKNRSKTVDNSASISKVPSKKTLNYMSPLKRNIIPHSGKTVDEVVLHLEN